MSAHNDNALANLVLVDGMATNKLSVSENTSARSAVQISPLSQVLSTAVTSVAPATVFQIDNSTLGGDDAIDGLILQFTINNNSVGSITCNPAHMFINQVQLSIGSPGNQVSQATGQGMFASLVLMSTQPEAAQQAAMSGYSATTFAGNTVIAAAASATLYVKLRCGLDLSDIPIGLMIQKFYLSVIFNAGALLISSGTTVGVTISNAQIIAHTFSYRPDIRGKIIEELAAFKYKLTYTAEKWDNLQFPGATIGVQSQLRTQNIGALTHFIVMCAASPATNASYLGATGCGIASIDFLNSSGQSQFGSYMKVPAQLQGQAAVLVPGSAASSTLQMYLFSFTDNPKLSYLNGKAEGWFDQQVNCALNVVPTSTAASQIWVYGYYLTEIVLDRNGNYQIARA